MNFLRTEGLDETIIKQFVKSIYHFTLFPLQNTQLNEAST